MARRADSTEVNSRKAQALARTISSSLIGPKRDERVAESWFWEIGSMTP